MAKKQPRTHGNAETMAAKQREISVSEFFAKNRHLLGFDNPRKALLTTIKEAVDNALDACEEAGIMPDIEVKIEELGGPDLRDGSRKIKAKKPGSESRATNLSSRYRVTITDNGPGIVRRQVENIFGKLLYGSKFHRLKMSRGQQGIGISAAGMYGLMTTGKPMVIHTKPHKNKPAHHIELAMDTSKNKPEVSIDVETDDFPEPSSGTGTMVAIQLEARFQRGKTSVESYLEQTAIANPHAKITFIPPDKASEDPELELNDSETSPLREQGNTDDKNVTNTIIRTTEHADRIEYPRTVSELPIETEEIKPHPYGVELGSFLQMLKTTNQKQLAGFFKHEFCQVTPATVQLVTKAANSKSKTITSGTATSSLDHAAAERIYRALQEVKLRNPPTNCLAPIGVRQMLAGMLKGVQAEFYTASTRPPTVYRGNPFQIEAAIGFGGDLPGDQQARVIRFANRVPLLYQQSACCSFKSVVETSWKNYGMSQPRGGAPVGPLVIMIHMASVWVPFTSESKEAIADYDEIRKEMTLALKECGRKLGSYIRRRQKMKREGERRDIFERYIGEISRACHALTGTDTEELYDALLRQAKHRTEIADAQLDEDGKFIKDENGRLAKDEDVIIIQNGAIASENDPAAQETETKPAKRPSKKNAAKKKIVKKVRKKKAAAGVGLFEG